jgi:hypothetical protein
MSSQVKKPFAKFRCEKLERELVSNENLLVVFDTIDNWMKIKNNHENIANFVFVCDFAFVKIGTEILDELCKDSRENGSSGEDRCCFMCVMEFDRCHVV